MANDQDFLGNLPTQTGEALLVVKGNTDKTYYPKRLLTDNTGLMETDQYSDANDVHGDYITFGRLKASISNATEGKGVTIYVVIEED